MFLRGRKKRDLTRTEAIQEAQEILGPFWLGSKPLWAPMHFEDGVRIFPLDDAAAKQDWVFVLFDPMALSGEAAFQHLVEWKRRYEANEVRFLGVVHTQIARWKENYPLALMSKRNPECPLLCIDYQNGYFQGLKASSTPVIAMMRNQQLIDQAEFGQDLDGAEKKLQAFLRLKDPGLPLLTPFHPNPPFQQLHHRFHLGEPCAPGMSFHPKKPFEKPKNQEIQVIGDWKREADGITTLDPQAQIRLRVQTSGLILIASAAAELVESESLKSSIQVEIDGLPPSGVYLGSDFRVGHQNELKCAISDPRPYHLLQHLRPRESEYILSFPGAKEQKGITLYAIDLI